VAIPVETYLVPGDTRTRGEHKFRPPNMRKDVYKYSFFPRTIGDWNRLIERYTQVHAAGKTKNS
jgi:hypothetical protein